MFTTRSELERWNQGIPPGSSFNLSDPLQFADPRQRRADEGPHLGATCGDWDMNGGGANSKGLPGVDNAGGPCGCGTYRGNTKGQDWPHGFRANYNDCQKLTDVSSSGYLTWEIQVERWTLTTGHHVNHKLFKLSTPP